MPNTNGLGSRIGPRISKLVADAYVGAKVKTQPAVARTQLTVLESFSRLMGSEAEAIVGGVAKRLASDPDVPEDWRKLFAAAAEPRGQFNVFAGAAFLWGMITGFMGPWATNEAAPVVEAFISKSPNLKLDPGTAAQLVAEGAVSFEWGEGEAKRSGIDDFRFKRLVELADTAPGLGEVLSAWNRGAADEKDVEEALKEHKISRRFWGPVKSLRRFVHSPESLAEMSLRGVLSDGEADKEAKDSGATSKQMDDLRGIVGQPPGLQEMLFMFRRGIINRPRLERGIRQSRIRNEWIDEIVRLRHAPMTASDGINAAVQNHVSERRAKKVWEENGFDPDDFEPVLETAGSPPGIEQMLELWNRGIMTRAEVVQGLRESRLKNKYIEQVLQLRRWIPPPRTITAMLRSGTISKKRGQELYVDAGVAPDLASAMAEEASAGKTEEDRKLAVTEIRILYEAEAISRKDTTDMLKELGYDNSEARFVLMITDLRRERKFFESAITRVRTLFINHRINDVRAQVLLDSIGVAPAQKANLLELWGLERAATVKTLTLAQVTGALRRDLMDIKEARSRLSELGYGGRDIDILLGLAQPAGR